MLKEMKVAWKARQIERGIHLRLVEEDADKMFYIAGESTIRDSFKELFGLNQGFEPRKLR